MHDDVLAATIRLTELAEDMQLLNGVPEALERARGNLRNTVLRSLLSRRGVRSGAAVNCDICEQSTKKWARYGCFIATVLSWCAAHAARVTPSTNCSEAKW